MSVTQHGQPVATCQIVERNHASITEALTNVKTIFQIFSLRMPEKNGQGLVLKVEISQKSNFVYALFLTQGPESKINGRALQTKRAVAPEGRFRVTENGTLESMTDRGFAGELNGAPLEKLIEQIRRAMEKTGRQ